MPLIRYPGSKAKLTRQLFRWLPDWAWMSVCQDEGKEYREPFLGSGSMAFRVMSTLSPRCRVWLNDIDGDLMALWQAVRDEPRTLMQKVVDFTPSAEAFYAFKHLDNSTADDIASRGFRKLALHRMSMSGFGYMSGGPLGGREQGSEYNVDCRWNPTAIKSHIRALGARMRGFGDNLKLTSLPFADVLSGMTADCFAYIDPPYYEKGPMLYRYAMNDEQHEQLAAILRATGGEWLTSYDDHAVIRELYAWADIHPVEVRYSNAVAVGGHRPKNREIAIVPRAASEVEQPAA